VPLSGIQKWFAPIKQVFPEAVWRPLRALGTGILTPIRFSTKTGHWKSSLREMATDASGAPIPWYTYPAIDFLSQRNFEDKNVLELVGGGRLYGGKHVLDRC
jgi:hypothetical protein